MILEEYDDSRGAVIDPSMIHSRILGFPETIVSIFSHILFDKLVDFLDAEEFTHYNDVDGVWPVYVAEYKGKPVAMVKARLGAPACVGAFEDVLAMGGKRIILIGNCGVLDKTIEDCGIIIPTRAIRDEGTSFHYAPPGDTIEVNKNYRDEFKRVCEECGYSYVEGTTWTTDAFYRETPKRIDRMRSHGAICVEMECAAVQALCDFRGVEVFQFFYAGDNLDHAAWEPRSLSGYVKLDDKEKIAMLGFELAARI